MKRFENSIEIFSCLFCYVCATQRWSIDTVSDFWHHGHFMANFGIVLSYKMICFRVFISFFFVICLQIENLSTSSFRKWYQYAITIARAFDSFCYSFVCCWRLFLNFKTCAAIEEKKATYVMEEVHWYAQPRQMTFIWNAASFVLNKMWNKLAFVIWLPISQLTNYFIFLPFIRFNGI